MSDILTERRAALEAEAAAQHREIKRWLTLANLAVPAVLEAAAGGNLRCLRAAGEMAALLPADFLRPVGPRPENTGLEPGHVEANRLGLTGQEACAPPSGGPQPGGENPTA